jgi:hypothetical protein
VVSSDSSNDRAGRIPGKRRASMVLPLPGYIGPRKTKLPSVLKPVGMIGIQVPRAETGSRWTHRLQAMAPLCACGCGGQIQLKPQHRCPTKGIPRYIQGHHPNPLRRFYAVVRAQGLLLTRDVCRKLRISETQYHRLEAAGVFPQPRRWGRLPRPRMRVFAPGDVPGLCVALRKALYGQRGLRPLCSHHV